MASDSLNHGQVTVNAHVLPAHEGNTSVENLNLCDGRHGLDSQVSQTLCDAFWWWLMVRLSSHQ